MQTAAFYAAQFVSSLPWGRLSDRIGRKPMIVMSNLSSCLSVIGFGLSTNYTTALLFRFAGGFFNCTFMYALKLSVKHYRPASYRRTQVVQCNWSH